MNNLGDYFSLHDHITELERELFNSRKLVSKWKNKYYKIKPVPPVVKDRYRLARDEVHKWCLDRKSRTLKSIADEYHISYETAKNVAYKWRKENKL